MYPHLNEIVEIMTNKMSPVKVFAHAEETAILSQITPSVHIVPGTSAIGDSIRRGRTITQLALASEWKIICLVRCPDDQRDMILGLRELGELLANVLSVICGGLTTTGGPLQIIDVPAAKTWAGGLVSGSIVFRLGWAFNPQS
jgi:hypothetical protein